MLFFYGTRSTAIAVAPLPDLACAYCHSPESLTCTIFSRYIHLFWIPVFPIGKSSVTVCQHCKQALTQRQMPASYRGPVQAFQQQASTPVTHYMLLALLGAVFLISFVASLFKPHQATEPASSTAGSAEVVGTRYKFNVTDDGRQYALMEVTRVTPDSVHYRMTNPLRGSLTAASASLALRDSVAPANDHQRVPTQQWQYTTSGQGLLKRLD